ncbi:hypothetical protein HU200_031382 [Digitaria exilis]|uniref:Uncharacterized protein n=1 Tax=Digitaria exilis TaxID=1010633 RepID=A0A835EMV5_9POAL|nr:hypothetical protein HU200_031382 [Digitaria exilis]CAB3476421.1 unnamed protein product [Digitaria exilis]
MEEAPELISPRISFSHDLANFTSPPTRRSDASLLVSSSSSSSSRLPEPEFDFATAINAAASSAADVVPADRLFAGGKLLPIAPLPPSTPRPNPRKQQQPSGGNGAVAGGRVKAACPEKRPGSLASSPFSRSSSVNSGATTAAKTLAGAPRSAGRFGCPPFPLMRSWSASAAVARDGGGLGGGAIPAGDHRARYKKFGGKVAGSNGGGSSRAYYYGGGRKGSSSSHGVRVSPVINVPFIGTSVTNVLSYLLCDCSTKTKKSREF